MQLAFLLLMTEPYQMKSYFQFRKPVTELTNLILFGLSWATLIEREACLWFGLVCAVSSTRSCVPMSEVH